MIIFRYLFKGIFSSLLIITAIILCALLSQQVVRYLNYVALGKIPINILLLLVFFEIPTLLSMLLPLGLYLGILLTYGRLHADNEMTFLELCGMSEKRLLRLTAVLGGVMSVGILILMLWVNPWIERKRQHMMTNTVITHLLQTLMPGRFQESSDGHYMVYVEKISKDHHRVKNIFLVETDTKKDHLSKKNSADANMFQATRIIILAKTADQEIDPVSFDQLLIFRDGYRYTVSSLKQSYNVIQFKKYVLHLPRQIMPSLDIEEGMAPPSWLMQHYDQPNPAAELQWRFSIPIATWILAMLAVPLSRIRFRRSRYLVLFPAFVVYIFYFNLLMVVKHWVEQGSIPISIGLWSVHFIMFLFLIMFFYFSHKFSRSNY